MKEHALRNPALLLVGNKTDLEVRQVSTRDGEKKAAAMDMLFAETSAKTTTGVQEAFNRLTEKMLDEYVEREPQPDIVQLTPTNFPSPKKVAESCGAC